MSHDYDDLVVAITSCTDYWRLDNDGNKNNTANLKKPDCSVACGISATDILPGTNNTGSFLFDGTDDYVTMTNDQLQQGSDFPASTGSFAMECWIQTATVDAGTDFVGIVVKNGAFGLCLYYGQPCFFTQLDGYPKVLASGSSALSDNTVYHLVGVYNAYTGDLKLYVNGVETGSNSTGTGGATAHNASNLAIGSWDTTVLFFEGLITNVALYDGILSEATAYAHYTWNA